jgi:Transposase DNA-binding/Transposase DDE domain
MRDVLSEFEDVLLPDARLVGRVQSFVAAAWKAPAKSFPKMLEDAADLEGGYRLLNNRRVSFEALHKPHQARTVERAKTVGSVVVVHDTTEVETAYAEPSETGYLSTGRAGYLAHVSLAQCVEPNRPTRPLGVLSVQTVFRKKPRKKQAMRSGATTARLKNKESLRWQQGIAATAEALQGCDSIVHVMDREADSYVIFAQIHQLQQGFVVRIRNDRRARRIDDEEDEEWSGLGKIAIDMQGVFQQDVPLSKRGAKRAPASLKNHPPRNTRGASLQFGVAQVEISRPRWAMEVPVPSTLQLNLVRVWEPEPPDSEPAVEWLLLTNEPCETPEEISRIVDIYRSRWMIEDFFKALKTGCSLEERQLESRHALLNTLALFLPIATHLLWIRTCARDAPDAPATEVFTPLQLTVLRHRSYRRMPDEPTARDALWALAGIGGHIANNGWPGWQVLGRAFETFLDALQGWKLAMQAVAEQKM